VKRRMTVRSLIIGLLLALAVPAALAAGKIEGITVQKRLFGRYEIAALNDNDFKLRDRARPVRAADQGAARRLPAGVASLRQPELRKPRGRAARARPLTVRASLTTSRAARGTG
jgi:hypothetical protein